MLPSMRKLAEHIAIPVKDDVTSLITWSIANHSSAQRFQVVNKRAQISHKRLFTVYVGIKRPTANTASAFSLRLSIGIGGLQSVEGRPQSLPPTLGHDPFQNRGVDIVKPRRKVGSNRWLGGHANRPARQDRNDRRQTGLGLAEGQHDAYSLNIERAVGADP
jgi:hypothetical protein